MTDWRKDNEDLIQTMIWRYFSTSERVINRFLPNFTFQLVCQRQASWRPTIGWMRILLGGAIPDRGTKTSTAPCWDPKKMGANSTETSLWANTRSEYGLISNVWKKKCQLSFQSKSQEHEIPPLRFLLFTQNRNRTLQLRFHFISILNANSHFCFSRLHRSLHLISNSS